MLKFLISVFFLFPSLSYSSEVDQYSVPESEVRDITFQLNDYANAAVGEALDKLNSEGQCDRKPEPTDPSECLYGEYCAKSLTPEEKLYKELRKIFANHGHGRLVDALLAGRIPRTVVPLKESVYKEWSPSNGFLLGRPGAEKSPLALGPLIKVGGIVVGSDKLEHMFGMGFAYFKWHYLNGKKIKTVLKRGIAAEKTYLGGNMLATGVFSYADLSANFNGMRFWNHMLQKNDDILGKEHNLGPYIACDNGKWEQLKYIDFSNYIDKSMKEDINCSKFATEEGLRKFRASLERLEKKYKGLRSFTCPASRDDLEEAASKYSGVKVDETTYLDHWIINRNGNAKLSYFNEF